MSLVEVLVAIVLLLIGVLGFTQSLVSSVTTGSATREAGLAAQAARRAIETMQVARFDEIFATFNDDPTDDPAGVGTAPGSGVPVPGLVAQPGDPDGVVGQILFATTAGAPGVLREDVVNSALGTPRDISGDGIWDNLDHSGDYRILPVVVRMRWRGKAGDSSLEFRTVLVDL